MPEAASIRTRHAPAEDRHGRECASGNERSCADGNKVEFAFARLNRSEQHSDRIGVYISLIITFVICPRIQWLNSRTHI